MSKLFGKPKKQAEPVKPAAYPVPEPQKQLTADYQLQLALDETKEQKKLLYYVQSYMQMELQTLQMQMEMMAKTQNKTALRAYARGIVNGRLYIAKIEENMIALNSFVEQIRASQINFKLQKELNNVSNVLDNVVNSIDDSAVRGRIKQFIKHSDQLAVVMDMQNDAMDSLVADINEGEVNSLIDYEVEKMVNQIQMKTIKPQEVVNDVSQINSYQ